MTDSKARSLRRPMKKKSDNCLHAPALQITFISLSAVLLTLTAATARDQLEDKLASASWIETYSLGTARYGHTATLLSSGKVLVTGGVGTDGFLSSAELTI